ncbi:hypothetical protein BS47DRAFT_1471805 [Hydnum rufescens UP504]|uniref:Aurora kinase n=1 Tax=Hydnum rufescens UP504 TaxID=1448309 RepID=A0A9P6DRB6_9AGAM|nr:hypothetical protein BS47DRAFT_1471805 [Hydnum rufescens UP504]
MFEMGGPLGKGQYGRVYMVRTKCEKFILALKVVAKAQLVSNHNERSIRREIRDSEKSPVHPHILRLYGFFHDETRIFLMLEYAGKGELYKQLYKAHGGFTEERSARYMHQITGAIMYLHSKHIIHRDIKPENLLLTIDDKLKIADFGWSVHSPSDRRKTYCGTLDYIPCEMIEKKGYSSKVDNWALGVLMYEFLSGCAPFARPSDPDEESRKRTQMRVVNVEYSFPAHFSREAKDLIRKASLLQHNPKDRLELCKVLRHPWILRFNPLPP